MLQQGVSRRAPARRADSTRPAACWVRPRSSRPASPGARERTPRAATRPVGMGDAAERRRPPRPQAGCRAGRGGACQRRLDRPAAPGSGCRAAARSRVPPPAGPRRPRRGALSGIGAWRPWSPGATRRPAVRGATALEKARSGSAVCEARPCGAAGTRLRPQARGRARPDCAARPGRIAGPAESGGPGWPTKAARRRASAA
jgi:hypothetical protein